MKPSADGKMPSYTQYIPKKMDKAKVMHCRGKGAATKGCKFTRNG